MSFSEWKEVKLGDVCDFQKGYAFKSKDYQSYGRNIIKVSNLNNYNIDLCNCVCIDESKTDAYQQYELFKDDVIITTVGSWPSNPNSVVGKVVKVQKEAEKSLLNQNAVRVRRLSDINQKYLFYTLKYKDFFDYIVGTAQGAANQASITQNDIKNYTFFIPSLEEQKVIADTLSCIDNKIELNNNINKTQEEMAQAIFKSWFVDFEPFQDWEFEDSEHGKIPKGWRVGTIGELISDTLGGDWGKETSQGNYVEEVTCIRGADIPEIALGKRGKPATRFILKKNLEKKQLLEGQIIIEISGGSPTQSTGRTALITKELIDMNDKPLICTNFCRALSLKKHNYSSFVYSMLQYLYNIDLFFIYENGTTGIKNLDTNNLFNKYEIVIPTDEILAEYKTVFSTLIKSIYKNGSESDMLSTVRDTLLPKLMSGEIRVPIEEVK